MTQRTRGGGRQRGWQLPAAGESVFRRLRRLGLAALLFSWIRPCFFAAWQSFSAGCERGDHPPGAAHPSLVTLHCWKQGD